MADQQYNSSYNNRGGDAPNFRGNRPSGNGMGDLPYWIAALVLLFVFPPVGILMLALRLFGGTKKKQVRGQHPYYAQRERGGPVGARTVEPAASPSSAPGADPAGARAAAHQPKLGQRGKALITVGGIMTAVFGFSTIMTLSDSLYLLAQGNVWTMMQEVIPLLCFLAGGVGMLWTGLRQRKESRRYRKYLSLIGRQTAISISTLASAMPASPERVRRELEDMLDGGWFPAGYLDYGRGLLVLSTDGLSDRKEPPKQEASAPVHEENAVLAEIKAVNDAIANEELSAQIDHVGMITAKIFDYQKTHPEKSPQLHSFLSYYLPTTLKILRAYAQLEAQGVGGANISAAMGRIEGMMDKVVEGFEKQLDQLFQGDAMDITTDVAVLEQMLTKDGLSADGMQLGI